MKSKRIAAHEQLPIRGYLESWEFAKIINDIFDDIGTCVTCKYYIDGFCHEKISVEDAEEDETSWEDLEKYFSKEEDHHCGYYKNIKDPDEEDVEE